MGAWLAVRIAGQGQYDLYGPTLWHQILLELPVKIGRREVKDKRALTREPEMVKATGIPGPLGVAFLSCISHCPTVVVRDCCRYGQYLYRNYDENLPSSENLLDEVFGPGTFLCVSLIKDWKHISNLLPSTVDYILWYAEEPPKTVKYFQLFIQRRKGDTSLE